ncbi:MAG: family 43 glycosylhydrolase, partial [Clostridia bacterium]|nr:family 43 glycosylhydrolase [Clostridia bacterium]
SYCNPLSIPELPLGDNYGSDPMKYTGEPNLDFRSISDPSVLFYDNKWFLYPSYGMCYVSEDFTNFKHVRTEPYNIGYSPSVIPHREKFLLTAHSNGLFIGDSPTGPFTFVDDFIKIDGSKIRPIDSALFRDDDGKIYIYWFEQTIPDDRGRFIARTMGVELDGDDPRKFKTEPVLIHKFNPDHYWERGGAYNQNYESGWVEGQWMMKHNGRYYMIYSSSGTEYPNYSMAAYYSDEGPLTGFKCQKHNPICRHDHGIVSGAGHGCIEHGPDNTLWAFYTITAPALHPFERRIGMDQVFVDENGELYCNVTDTPQLGYGETPGNNDAGLLPVNARLRHRVRASSYASG